ncbi:MAG: hypothetical protein KAH99_06225, partial [Verrucomicrobia bacterium]|nr:hypothetical protein [Verrucomicrobiota bacterium]
MKKYVLSIFILCFFVWGVVVDNVVLPSGNQLRQDVGSYTRYRVKKWQKGSKLDVIQDELMVYAIVKNREQLYYMEHKTYFENTLKSLPEGTPVQLRYVRRFPKLWKRHLYDLREGGIPIIRYSAYQLKEKQKEIWKFTGIMAGIFLALAGVG